MTERESLAGRQRESSRGGRASGLTLIEISLIIGLLGLTAIYLTEDFIADLKMRQTQWQAVAAINDAHSILDVSRAYWHSIDSSTTTKIAKWPNVTTTSGSVTTTSVSIRGLLDTNNQFLSEAPPTRFPVECNGACSGYAITGWDTSSTPPGPSTTTLNDEIQISFEVPDKRRAKAIAAQLPLGSYASTTSSTYEVTARIDSTQQPSTGQCLPANETGDMRLCGEDKDMEFSSSGKLNELIRIARQAQDLSKDVEVTCTAGSRLAGAGIGMDGDKFSFAACGDSSTDPSAALVMEDDGSDPSMVGTFSDGKGNEHKFTYAMEDPFGGDGTSDYERVPYLEFQAYSSSSTTTQNQVPLTLRPRNALDYHYREPGLFDRDESYPASWDLYLMDSSSTSTCHRPVQFRICRLRQVVRSAMVRYSAEDPKFNYDATTDSVYDPVCFEAMIDSASPPALTPPGCP